MMGRPKTRWIFLLSLVLVLTAFSTVPKQGQAGKFVGTAVCIDCHQTWLDNNPQEGDVVSGNASTDYPPLNLANHRDGNPPFYTIPEGWTHSIHNVPAFDLTKTDEVPCEACHGGGQAHWGLGNIPVPIPDIKTCGSCHNSTHDFDLQTFLKTAHANPNRKPGKYFDQPTFGPVQGKITKSTPPFPVTSAPVGTLLFKSGTFDPLGDPVTRSNRIEECSVCHQYAMQYPQFRGKIDQGNLPPKPAVSCGACHDSHIVAPDGLEPAVVTSTVAVTAVTSGTTPVSVSAVPGRQVSYINNKPYRLNDKGAQEVRVGKDGLWTRGSAINRPQTTLIKGTCGVVSGGGTCSQITFTCESCAGVGFLNNQVKERDTIFVSGVASVVVTLPSDAKNAGQSVTVQATLDMAGFEVFQVIDNNNLIVDPPVVANATLRYTKANGTAGSLSVPVPFCGVSLNFEIRDMLTNTWDLCGACHTQGKFKYTKWGKKPDGTLADLSATHNIDVRTQYNTSGHADVTAPAFEEFNAFSYASSHAAVYPFDMSITGSGGVGSFRNKGNTTFQLINDPDPINIYLIAKGTISQPIINNAYACYQCHNGLGSIDYFQDVQGTSAARVLWGDATVVCITCHDPHANEAGPDSNVRKPVKLSYNSFFVDPVKNPRGGINKFMDGTDIPSATENGIVCLFCHQGRESGLTVFLNVKSKGVDPYATPDKVISASGVSFQNPHYLESGALIWSRNAWEYLSVSGAPTPNKYSSGIPKHQQQNCMGCHMGEASPNGLEGGHTWRPRIETCQKCHTKPDGSPITSFHDIQASADFDGDGTIDSAFAEIGTVNDSVAGTVDSGLVGQLDAALRAKGIFYDPNTYPYFFTSAAETTAYTAWTSNTLTAAFNLSFLYKSGNCAYVHNIFYSAQILLDSLKALGVTSPGYKNRPAGDRPATDYRTIVVNP